MGDRNRVSDDGADMTATATDLDTPEQPRWPLFSTTGILVGALFFTASLTPSMLPRDPMMQGILGGVVAIIGHEIGRAAAWLWRWLGFWSPPAVRGRWRIGAIVVAVLVIAWGLFRAAHWQNLGREFMGMAPVDTSHPVTIGWVAALVFALLWLAFRLFGLGWRWAGAALRRVVPPRIASAIGLAVIVTLFWALIDGVLVRAVFRVTDASFGAANALIEPGIAQPDDPLKSGSPESLIDWRDMGRRGREFVARAPTAAEIAEFVGPGAREPIRIYVGMASARTARGRAELALAEMIRTGAFERDNLLVMVPVGTGWMDPGGQDSFDFMLGGNTATVAVQYSYLTSVLSLLFEPEYGIEQSRELFDLVYDHWSRLPPDNRPRFYVHGLSQGALLSQATLPFLDILGDPIDGAMWAGSPFMSPFWVRVRDHGNPGSPAARPTYGNGSLVRVVNQQGGLDAPHGGEPPAPWGPLRMVMLNYASDPIVNFRLDAWYRRPAWMADPRAADINPHFRWFPVVTMFQLAVDMALALQVPRFGHYYAYPDYIYAWSGLLDLPDWSADRRARLDAIMDARGPAF
jgi:uncharacterized membrane protein